MARSMVMARAALALVTLRTGGSSDPLLIGNADRASSLRERGAGCRGERCGLGGCGGLGPAVRRAVDGDAMRKQPTQTMLVLGSLLAICAASCRVYHEARSVDSARASTHRLVRPAASAARRVVAMPCPSGAVLVQGRTIGLRRYEPDYWFEPSESCPPPVPVFVESFCLDRFEVRADSLRRCEQNRVCAEFPAIDLVNDPTIADPNDVLETGQEYRRSDACSRVSGRGDLPANCVRFEVARQYCRARGGELPAEEQLQLAGAIEPEAQYVPMTVQTANLLDPVSRQRFLDRVDLTHALETSDPEPFLLAAERESPDVVGGVYNLHGNVAEWVLTTELVENSMQVLGATDPMNPRMARIRGGHYLSENPRGARTSVQIDGASPWFSASYVGFRCAYPILARVPGDPAS
jgi:formylglycine-generating enzyme required for sulfatase activity